MSTAASPDPGETLLDRLDDSFAQVELKGASWPYWIHHKHDRDEFFHDPTKLSGYDDRRHPYWRGHFADGALEISKSGIMVYKGGKLSHRNRTSSVIPFAQLSSVMVRKGWLIAEGRLIFATTGAHGSRDDLTYASQLGAKPSQSRSDSAFSRNCGADRAHR